MASSSGKEQSSGGKIRAARLSAAQFEVLIQYMRQHPHFAVGRSTASGGCYWSYSKEEHDRLWRTLTSMLNETEGPVKSVTKWQKCWVDLKSNARSRAAKWRALPHDGTTPSGSMFTQWDEQVLSLLSEITSNENNFVPVVAQSPMQLVEVGFSDKMTSNQNGFHDSEDGALTIESVSSHGHNKMQDLHQSEDGVGDLSSVVKSEKEDWPDNDRVEDYSEDNITPGNESGLCTSKKPDALPARHFSTNGDVNISRAPNEQSSRSRVHLHHRPHKRKQGDTTVFLNEDESVERFSKKICGALERMANAAEEANAIQRGMVNAMSRIASSFEQLLPVVAKIIANNSDLAGSV